MLCKNAVGVYCNPALNPVPEATQELSGTSWKQPHVSQYGDVTLGHKTILSSSLILYFIFSNVIDSNLPHNPISAACQPLAHLWQTALQS